jgi:TonB family protein
VRPVIAAAFRRPTIADLARATGPRVSAPEPIEDEVFGRKRYYSMALSMPNLTSSSGSWILRFAELNQSNAGGNLVPPIAVVKVDPAYPPSLMREHVEGTVVLYALIRSDGSVSAVRVLHGVDQRLDENARVALAQWHFRPATKNGSAVDLEAVVQIPFRAAKMIF